MESVEAVGAAENDEVVVVGLKQRVCCPCGTMHQLLVRFPGNSSVYGPCKFMFSNVPEVTPEAECKVCGKKFKIKVQ